ncbi:activating transcription factor 7-interacting protein 1 isoform X2 [Dicentrarchus labrax]|uniref:activating transcription factor 7-interacting protein 1 isoform X2 n=1 Tax=Dicentrarchus labrax TaxID=13489 RepID=UPI0021F66D5D|nr:activating transcription factor 7-interacting protein 1 isoform X2 [Dicentrarchus labrax]
MEVVVTEEKKKIFRARKTMKISDRQQLESLHSTLLTAAPGLSDTSPPPLMNGTHKEDGQKMGDKELNNISDSNSPSAASPASPTSLSSPAPFLSLNLSPSPDSSQSPKEKEDSPSSPSSPFHSLNFELKKMEEGEKKGSLPSSSNESVTPASTESKENQEKDTGENPEMEKKEAEQTSTKDPAVDLVKDLKGLGSCSSVPPPVSDCTEPMDTDNDTIKDPEGSTAKEKDEKPSSPKATTSDSSVPCPSSSRPASSSCADLKQEKEIKDQEIKKEEIEKEDGKKGSINETKMELDSVKVETKKEKTEVRQTTKPSRPSSTPPSNTVQEEKGSTSGLKRTLSEGYEKDGQTVKREGKRPKVEREELEAQLELKITAKAGSHHKLEKIVQQLVDERLRALQLTIFDKHFEELKDRVDKIDCATKHQTAINTLQAKIARLAKKFGEANQASENKRKQEALAAVAAAAAAATAAATAAAKTATVANNPQVQRPVRTSMEVKQTPTTVSSSSSAANLALSAPPALAPAPTPTSTAMVTQAPILQLITSTSNAASTLATGITTQSPTGTLLLKTTAGSSMMTTGQPLLIQLPLSMANGQAGTLVNIPVSSLSAASSLNKAKTTSTATFILKPAPAITTAAVSTPASATVPTLQASTCQMSQISLARAVYQGGAGGITTPNAGVSVTTARTPAQSVSVAGAMSSASSPATTGPAATGSTAPGPPQGTSLTSKTVQSPDPSAVPAVPRQLSPPRDEEAGPKNPLSAVRRETAKDGTVWTYIELGEDRGRRQCQNVITEAAGPTVHAKRNIVDALTAFLCLVDDDTLKHIRDCTVAEAHRVKEDKIWDMTVEELKAFIGLIYIQGAQGGKGMDLASFWSAEWGCAFFKETMSRNRFQEIMQFLCFDRRETPHTRLRDNKFALMSDVWDRFVQNSIGCYKPGADITVDEQLLPTKARCSFLQYMANKPDKFGIKFWLAADVDTKYMVNGAPYLGKEETRGPGQLGDSVVLKMVERRRQCQVRRNCKKNKTKETCAKCHKVVCGSCTRKAVFTCVDCA